MTIDKKQPVELKIEKVAYGGKGIARKDGKVYFIHDTVPGDIVQCEITHSKKSFAEGKVQKFLEKSTLRKEAKCQYYSECGGCGWQDISYHQQLDWKKGFVEEAFERVAKQKLKKPVEMLGSPSQFEYRSRVTLRVHIKNERVKIGFFKKSKRELVDVERCEISEPSINKFIHFFRNETFTDIPDQKFRIEIQVVPLKNAYPLANTFQGRNEKHLAENCSILVTLHPAEGKKQNLSPFLKRLANYKPILWCGSVKDLPKSDFIHFEKIGSLEYFALPGQFHQINQPHNLTLRQLVQKTISENQINSLLDVFCGSGNLSIALNRELSSITGVEFNQRSIAAANHTLKANKIKNCNYTSLDATKYIKQLTPGQFDAVLLDPPREGFKDGMPALLKIKPRYIIYVSCDPMTLARDIAALAQDSYTLEKIITLDFFPHTFHIETFVLLKIQENPTTR